MRPVIERLQLSGVKSLTELATLAQDWMQRAAVIINDVIDGYRTQHATRNTAVNTTLDESDCVIEADATGGAITVSLPILSGNLKVPVGKEYRVMKIDSSANAVTVSANTGQTINGAASVALSTQYSIAVITVGTGTDFRRWIL